MDMASIRYYLYGKWIVFTSLAWPDLGTIQDQLFPISCYVLSVKQAVLSRATLQDPISGCWDIPLLIFWGRPPLEAFYILRTSSISGGSTFDMVGEGGRAGQGDLWGTNLSLQGDHFNRGSLGEINSQVYCTYVFRYISFLKCITRVNKF